MPGKKKGILAWISGSVVLDLFIVIGDFLTGIFITNRLFMKLDGSPPLTRTQTSWMYALLLAFIASYITGIYINRKNLKTGSGVFLKNWDGLLLSVNGLFVACAVFIPLSGMIDISEAATIIKILFFTLLFVCILLWIFYHYRIAKFASCTTQRPSFFKKIIGILMVYPLTVLSLMALNWIIFGMTPQEEVTFGSAFFYLLIIGAFAATIVGWGLAYIPRKFLKAIAGVEIKSSVFFWSLLISAICKILGITFLRPM